MKVVCGAKVPRERKFHGTKVLGLFAPQERMFHGTKVLGTFAFEERKFHGSESSTERKFLDFSLLGSECSMERKFHGTGAKVLSMVFSLPGTKVQRNEKASYRFKQGLQKLAIALDRKYTQGL